MPALPQELVAFHEAGHAVACVLLKVEHEHATIRADDHSAGHVRIDSRDAGMFKPEHVITVLCSGYAAALLFAEDESKACIGCDSDFRLASELIERNGLSGDLKAWQARAVALISDARNAEAVASVAMSLVERQLLPSDYVSILVEVAYGTCGEEEASRYMAEQDRVRASSEGTADHVS